MKSENPLDYFEFRPIKTAKVSEISEATAASDIQPAERVNFHIGNPVQDDRLKNLYFKLITNDEDSSLQNENNLIDTLFFHTSPEQKKQEYLTFLKYCIEKFTPYMPRGGYSRNDPGEIVEYLKKWFTVNQQEPLEYDFGETGGQREVILSNGGMWEDLRILFFSISKFLIHLPAKIFLFDLDLPSHLMQFSSIEIMSLPENETTAVEQIEHYFKTKPDKPTFLILGKVTTERTRRALRQLSINYPLFFIECNNAPNHLSMQREAKMQNRVLRFIMPSVFSPALSQISVSFIAGNADFIRIIESVQFELKGTPAVAEIVLLSYLLKNGYPERKTQDPKSIDDTNSLEKNSLGITNTLKTKVKNVQEIFERINASFSEMISPVEKALQTFSKYGEKINDRIQQFSVLPELNTDTFSAFNTTELINYFFRNLDNSAISAELGQSFLSAFLIHHPEYDIKNCFIISGSARTALSLLGFHCDIREAISVDLSWTYEHCFPEVEILSLSDELSLDVNSIIERVEKKIASNPQWQKSGAVVLNNPHNASGQIFNEEKISKLLNYLLERNIYVIDDLSYQNVLPEPSLNGPKTLRQVANQLTAHGYLNSEKIKNLITVHSLSKTDCFAGARLAVVEILHPELHNRFREIAAGIKPNNMAILIAYLFYRNHPDLVREFWLLRNQIFNERMRSLEEACYNLPAERNPFEIEIRRPAGSMYPHMIINKLPHGLSLDWLSSRLASRGIGLIPLTTFARTAKGYELARKTFRLTLGGDTEPEELLKKTRRVLIDLNRMIADEEANYNRRELKPSQNYIKSIKHFDNPNQTWDRFSKNIKAIPQKLLVRKFKSFSDYLNNDKYITEFRNHFLPERIEIFKQRFIDRVELAENILTIAKNAGRQQLVNILHEELYKDNLETRTERFGKRLFDRTVHPTQMYALKTDLVFNRIIDKLIQQKPINENLIQTAICTLTDEFLGLNVPINSADEADELVTDLKMVIMAEEYTRWNSQNDPISFLSFWGDWDGSTRPSGQGHHLVMAVLIENVTSMADMLSTLLVNDTSINIEPNLLHEIHKLKAANRKFSKLSNKITLLTNELEERYLSVLPIDERVSRSRKLKQRLGLVKDPMSALWEHNDKLEKRMRELRIQRRKAMEYYFSLNKRLRKTLQGLLPQIENKLHLFDIAIRFGTYRDLLKRFVLTPRIHQKIITSTDQFTIDTTIHNIMEINEISGKYGNPGMVLALQVSMTTKPEAIISLDRKSRSRREYLMRENPENDLPFLRIIPLFEDSKTVSNMDSFLNKLWEYCVQSRRIDQDTEDRFTELISEIFIAGSDLSQQVGQPAGLALYKEAKFRAIHWLAERGLVEKIRLKLGSGEPMQRQGGYYEPLSGKPAFIESKDARERLESTIKDSTCKSTQYARSPLRGVLLGGDLRTFQSTISEKIRMLPMEERAQLLYHIRKSQKFHRNELSRTSEPMLDTRLKYKKQSLHELEMITYGQKDELYNHFLDLTTRNFREILYGREEDIIGIHIILYFISRSIPTFRDRPTIRPSREMDQDRGQQIIERIARTLPLSHYGSLLRAIGHNRAQTMVLGVNQLSTGLFRSLFEFADTQGSYSDGLLLISDRILPHLPVHDLLHTLRIYHDTDLEYLKNLERAFPAGNSSFILLREDNDAIYKFVGTLQKELLRRHGLDVSDFFDGDEFNPQLLPALRPDLAVLLQPDLFNTDLELLVSKIGGKIEKEWLRQVRLLLEIPENIRIWRKNIWNLIGESAFQQIESFVHLALAIHKVYEGTGGSEIAFSAEPGKVLRLSTEVADLLRRNKDDSMRQFLIAAVQYLTQLPKIMTEVPIDIVRALRNVETIVKIEEQALSKREQDLLRFYIIQMARICGENG